MKRRLLWVSLSFFSALAFGAQVAINPSEQYQQIDGFGAGGVYYNNWVTAHPQKEAIYDTMFTGLGLSYLRLGNWNQDTTAANLSMDSTIVAEGRKRLGDRFKILLSSWSAPSNLKVSGQINGSTNGNQLPKSQNTLKKVNGQYVYAEFAHWWKRSVEKYQAAGMAPDVISIQNEPDMNATYEATIFDATESDSLAGYPQALAAVRDSINTLSVKPKIYGPEVLGIGYSNFQKYANQLDPNDIEGYNFHLYHGSTGNYENPDNFIPILQTLTSTYPGKSWMMSEYCPMRSSVELDMLTLAQLMYNLLVYGNASSYINWELYWGDEGQMIQVYNPWNTGTFGIGPEYHAMRHFSKFTGPGWYRVGATSDQSDLKSVAFLSSGGDSLTLVAINQGNSTISMDFAATGYSQVIDSWQSVVNGVKSSRLNLSGTATNASLPAQSITTIVLYNNSGTPPSSSSAASSSSTSSSSEARAPYQGVISLPGTLELENYDKGGEGVAYHDTEASNQGNAYRTDGVDLAGAGTGNYAVGWTADGEWLEYTVNFSTAGPFQLEIEAASGVDGAQIHLEIGGSNISGTISFTSTGDWNTYQTFVGEIASVIGTGEKQLRVVIDKSAVNIDAIRFIQDTTTAALPTFDVHAKPWPSYDLMGRKVPMFGGLDRSIVFDKKSPHGKVQIEN